MILFTVCHCHSAHDPATIKNCSSTGSMVTRNAHFSRPGTRLNDMENIRACETYVMLPWHKEQARMISRYRMHTCKVWQPQPGAPLGQHLHRDNYLVIILWRKFHKNSQIITSLSHNSIQPNARTQYVNDNMLLLANWCRCQKGIQWYCFQWQGCITHMHACTF